MAQTSACMAYLGKKFGLRAKSDEDQAHEDQMLLNVADALSECLLSFFLFL